MISEEKELDLRIRRTRKSIIQALFEMICEKDFNKISVTEICARALVHRTTFYKHFEDKYDLLNQAVETLTADLREQLVLPENPEQVFSIQALTTNFRSLFDHFERNKSIYSSLLTNEGNETFRHVLRSVLYTHTLDRLSYLKGNAGEIVPLPVIIEFIVGSTTDLIYYWLNSGQILTPEKMAQYCSTLFSEGIYSSLGVEIRKP